MSIEVAEHVPESFEKTYLDNLDTCGSFFFFLVFPFFLKFFFFFFVFFPVFFFF